MKEVKLIIADDHPLLLEGLHTHLKNLNYNVVALAKDGATALKLIIENKPHVAILDIEMPYMTGIDVAKTCLDKGLDTHFILLTLHKELSYIVKAKKLNLSGYILKDDALIEIDNCIKTVLKGKKYYSAAIKNIDGSIVDKQLSDIAQLTPSQLKILTLVSKGLTTREIASKLYISERTVEKHRSNIISSLGIDSQKENLHQWILKNQHILDRQ